MKSELRVFKGLSAFPLTPVDENGILEKPFVQLLQRLGDANVDSIGVLGSTGIYAYLSRCERARAIEIAVEYADHIPVMAGIGALRTRDVLTFAEDAQRLGASAVMLAPVSYQRLTEDEVFGLFRQTSEVLSVPLCVYDNPTTTHFNFTDDLYVRIAQLPNVASIKIPPLQVDGLNPSARIRSLKALLPEHCAIGISGDWCGVEGLIAGCDIWYSAIGGVLPVTFMQLAHAAINGNKQLAIKMNQDLDTLLSMIKQFGSLRVSSGVAQIRGFIDTSSLPRPLQGLSEVNLKKLAGVLRNYM